MESKIETVESEIKTAKPFVKWVGGKRQMIAQFEPLFPKTFSGYYEPMVGGGAIFFHLRSRMTGRILLADVNVDLVTAYQELRDHPDDLFERLRSMAWQHDMIGERYYYEVRATVPINSIQRAARFMYLTRAGFNGLWRVNSKGQHNVPVGRNSKKEIYNGSVLFDFENLESVSKILQGVDLSDQSILPKSPLPSPCPVGRDYFAYVDPPYCAEKDSSFTKYQQGEFGFAEQIALAKVLTVWGYHGAKVFLSNSDVPLIRELYQAPTWNLTSVSARQNVAAGKGDRGIRQELVIRNYQ